MKLHKYSIKKIYFNTLIIIILLITGATVSVHILIELNKIDESTKEMISSQGTEFQGIFNDFLRRNDIHQIKRVFSSMSARKNFVTTWLSNPEGIIIVSDNNTNIGQNEKDLLKKYKLPLKHSNNKYYYKTTEYASIRYPIIFGASMGIIAPNRKGNFWLIYNMAAIREEKIKNIFIFSMGHSLLITMFLLSFSILLYKYAKGRVSRIASSIEKFSDGDRKVNFIIEGKDEISQFSYLIQKNANKLIRSEKTIKANEEKIKHYLDIIDKYVIRSHTDKYGVIKEISEAFCNISGYKREELLGKHHNILRHPDMKKETFKNLWKTIKSGKTWNGEIKNRKKNDGYYWVSAKIMPTYDSKGKINGYASIRNDITYQKKVEEISVKDELTGLYNRRYFNENFQNILKRNYRYNKYACFIMLDIDFFKKYNDTYGHLMGDKALKKVSDLLSKLFQRAGDISFRLGGEEFGIIPHAKQRKDCETLCDNILNAMRQLNIEHLASETADYMTISMGVCSIENSVNLLKSEFIYKKADEALYISKDKGRNQFSIINI
ncbi:MAG: diguanylate cyclase [Spirochaetia bacterium]|nr:diguanylate cyclase [Spirochaetia bacterium]